MFIDTNIVLRYLTQPSSPETERMADICRQLFERVEEGTETVTTSEAVITEIVYVLRSPRWYAMPRARSAPA